MTEEARLRHKTRLWLYIIALMHLVCLALMYRQSTTVTHASSRYAMLAPVGATTLLQL
jgi:hypothetical protein